MFPNAPGTYPFEHVVIDKLGPFPISNQGNKHVLILVDSLTKFVVAKAVPNGTAVEVAAFLWQEILLRHGAPKKLQSDLGKEFNNHLLAQLNTLLGTNHKFSSPYRPQTQGLVEKFNQCIANMISKYVTDQTQDTWDNHLQELIFAFNTSAHAVTKVSPFYALFGYEAVLPIDVTTNNKSIFIKNKALPNFITLRAWIRDQILKSQEKSRQRFDDTHSPIHYDIGDTVLIKNNRRIVGLATKLRVKWLGPAIIVQKLNDLNYKIQYTGNNKTEVVHVQRLKRGDKQTTVRFHPHISQPPATISKYNPHLIPLPSIIKRKQTQIGRINQPQARKVLLPTPSTMRDIQFEPVIYQPRMENRGNHTTPTHDAQSAIRRSQIPRAIPSLRHRTILRAPNRFSPS
jgi:hypothetical protein